jgi:hypothetical protein
VRHRGCSALRRVVCRAQPHTSERSAVQLARAIADELVATAGHRRRFAAALADAGVDVEAAVGEGRYLALDAAGVPTRFMVAGKPNASRFCETVGPLIERAAEAAARSASTARWSRCSGTAATPTRRWRSRICGTAAAAAGRARIGGDEFSVLLIRCDERAAHNFTARLLEAMAEQQWPPAARISVSVGHASLQQSTSPAKALHRGDLAMLSCKRARRRA